MMYEKLKIELEKYNLSRRVRNILLRNRDDYNSIDELIECVMNGRVKQYRGLGVVGYRELLIKVLNVDPKPEINVFDRAGYIRHLRDIPEDYLIQMLVCISRELESRNTIEQ